MDMIEKKYMVTSEPGKPGNCRELNITGKKSGNIREFEHPPGKFVTFILFAYLNLPNYVRHLGGTLMYDDCMMILQSFSES